MSAAEEIHRHGYGGASLERILTHSGVTKGALYHHFGSKAELAFAVIDEVLRPMLAERWLEPLDHADDPISGFAGVLRTFSAMSDEEMAWGCPVNNLSQEMANDDDEEFRLRLASVIREWQGGIAAALRRGQETGAVRTEVDVEAVAAFMLASFEGLASLAKTTRDRERAGQIIAMMTEYLNGLRPAGERVSA
jgi:TetR/AcrR family transcriptional repressor of nem operon